jgi:hypothetical protein
VDRVVRRHKTLGAWVPVWVGGPCRNPECADRAVPETGATGEARVAGDAADHERVTTAKEPAQGSAADSGGAPTRKT